MSTPAEQSLREGKLRDAISQLQDQVRQQPAEAKHRVFLFQLLAVDGQWERSLTQLKVAGDLDASTLMMVQAYREAIQCEALRRSVFAGERSPLLFGEPEQWLALMMESLRCTAAEKYFEASDLRNQAYETAPTTSGTIVTGDAEGEGRRFEWIADSDTRLGPVLEAYVNGSYYWIPFHRISEIQLEAPADLRDVVWMPAHFVWSNGGDAMGLIPTRYPGSELSDDDQIRLSRMTDWQEFGPGGYQGLGQRMLTTDDDCSYDDFPLMDVRKITLDAPPPDSPAE